MSQASITNTRIGSNSTQTDLLVFLQQFNSSKLYSDILSFPNLLEDKRPLPNNIWLNDYSLLECGRKVEQLMNGVQEDVLNGKRPAQVGITPPLHSFLSLTFQLLIPNVYLIWSGGGGCFLVILVLKFL